jgi:hypothetical protein
VDVEGDVDVEGVDDAEEVVEQPATSPVTAPTTAAAAIHLVFLFDTNRRTRVRSAGLTEVAEANGSGEGAGGEGGTAPAPPVFPATGPDVAFETGRAERVS